MGSSGSLNELLLTHWTSLERQLVSTPVVQSVDGHNLSIATVVLVARLVTALTKQAYPVNFYLDTRLS